jgi:hypothetical protein
MVEWDHTAPLFPHKTDLCERKGEEVSVVRDLRRVAS